MAKQYCTQATKGFWLQSEVGEVTRGRRPLGKAVQPHRCVTLLSLQSLRLTVATVSSQSALPASRASMATSSAPIRSGMHQQNAYGNIFADS